MSITPIIYSTTHRLIFVYNTDSANGTYKWGAKQWRQHFEYIRLNKPGNSIIFIELNYKASDVRLFDGTFTISEVSVDNVKTEYSHKKWLRKRLARAGYESIDELVAGYHVTE